MKYFLVAILIVSGARGATRSQEQAPMKDCPMHPQHQASMQHDDVNRRGEQGMGFSQEKTTHHFLLSKNGGSIQVTANSSQDSASIDEIRMHLRHIERA